MQFVASLPTYGSDKAAQAVWAMIAVKVGELDGICYYRHPVIAAASRSVPDLTLLADGYQPVAVVCLPYQLEEIGTLNALTWTIHGQELDSPLLDLEDYVVGLTHKFDRERRLRHLLKPQGVVAMPLVARAPFQERFGPGALAPYGVIWNDGDVSQALTPVTESLPPTQWRLAKSVFQGIQPLNRGRMGLDETSSSLGGAITILEREIALLDDEQHKVAVQIAPGPQRIRGLAGTGKTVVLAMKAANIHLRFPESRILFTFNTQSLYNQARSLITKFYRVNSEADPNWDLLHVRHGWGGASRPGVYSDACRRLGIAPLTLAAARTINPEVPFKACCEQLLKVGVKSVYDFVLLDEAQDFPQEFFRVLAQLATPERRIYFAYDELQSLSNVEVPPAEQVFGVDDQGKPLVSLAGDDYDGGIEKDFVLHRSYRCPHEVLMLAHGIGLGIHAERGCVQMLGNKESWTATGYEVREGSLKTGEPVVICRPKENSPNRIRDIYTGTQPAVVVEEFENREAELEWVAASIANDVKNEGVRPEQIVVISLNSIAAKRLHVSLQLKLLEQAVQSTIPGLVDDSSEFAEPDRVTLSTVYRAKGNEAPIVYIIGFDDLLSYVAEVRNRNRAFTSISRAKAWVRITGVGRAMTAAKKEIQAILKDIPCFRFAFPEMERIARRLDASETSRRRREVKKAEQSVQRLVDIDQAALSALDPALLKRLRDLLDQVDDVDK